MAYTPTVETLAQETLGRDGAQLAAHEQQRLLSRLVARLAHEIRNPLGSLDIHVQLLEEDLGRLQPPPDAAISGRVHVIRTELHRLDAIVRRFISLAAPSDLNPQPIELADLIDHIVRLLNPEAVARGIALDATLPTQLPTLTADPGQLTQALMNLVVNALQAVDSGGRIHISVTTEAGPAAVAIAVADTGPGIPPEKCRAIFEPFFTTKADGSGLGLWIVQQIATAHGGSVVAANAPERGAVVTLRLPLQRTAEQP